MTSAKTHISLNVANVDASVRFYSALFGLEPHKRFEDYANFDVENPPLKLALVQCGETRESGRLNHLGIFVPDSSEVDAAKERLIRAGLATFTEEDATCCYAVQDKVWVHDPDGNAWEIYAITDDAPNARVGLPMAMQPPCCGD